MQQRSKSRKRLIGGLMLAAGLAWLLWVCFLGFALRDGLAHGLETGSAWGILQTFLAEAWHMLFIGLLVSFAGVVVLLRTGRHT